jgi:hypothetical protein
LLQALQGLLCPLEGQISNRDSLVKPAEVLADLRPTYDSGAIISYRLHQVDLLVTHSKIIRRIKSQHHGDMIYIIDAHVRDILTELRPSEESGDCAASRITFEEQNVKRVSLPHKLLLINLVKLPKLFNNRCTQLFSHSV